MRWIMLSAGLVLAVTGCTEGLGQEGGQALGSAMDRIVASGIEAEGIVARRLYSGDDIRAPWISTFSPDGRFQAFTDWSSGDGDLAIRDLESGEIRHLTASAERGFAMGMRFSGDGQHVAYGWWRNDRYVLNAVRVDGSEVRTILDPRERGANEVVAYDWTADGQTVLVGLVTWEKPTASGFEGMGYELVTVSVADGSIEVLIPFAAEGRIPYGRAFFSPDGRYVAFSTVTAGSDGLADAFLLDRRTNGQTVVLGGPAEEQVLGWSRDGGHLYLLSDRRGSPSLWAIPVRDGKAEGTPVLLRGDLFGFVSGHVAGDKLLYHVVSESPELLQVDIDPVSGGPLSEPSRVVTGGSFWEGELAAWSPDGESLAFIRGNPARVVVQAAQDGNHIQVFDLPTGYTGAYSLRWRPDSRSLVISARSMATQGTSRMLTLHLDSGQFEPGPVNPAEGRPVSHDLHAVFKTDGGGIESISLTGSDHHYLWNAEQPGPATGVEGCAWGRGRIAISPSDDRLAVTTWTPGRGGCIGVISTQGGAINWIHRSAADEMLYGLEWSSDGASVHFLVRTTEAMDEIWTIPASGGDSRQLFQHENIVGAAGLAVHPDGDRLVFRAGEENYELWMMEGLEQAIVVQ